MVKNSVERFRLRNAPVTLTLCQVRFSTIRKLDQQIPAIQETLAASGYELDLSDKVHEFTITPEGPQAQVIDRWEFADLKRTRSVVITRQFAVFQTTAYDTFENFVSQMLLCMDTIVLAGSRPIVTRVGLRYTNAIVPTTGKPMSFYLHQSLLGVGSPVLRSPLIAHNTIAETAHGRMLVRIMQNREKVLIPVELGPCNLLTQRPPLSDESTVTLLDFDHFKEWRTDATAYEKIALEKLLWNLKGEIYDVFKAFVTPAALEEWK
jgi:uncharacterized protein (TIGR04255 family)